MTFLINTATLFDRYYKRPYFTGDKNEAQRG